ncbi:hypothetical protein FEM48_Zijuj01G0207700 [Ziziphus jujuba var. spinosa]|uniref:Disease resistance protein At4g27190-like leucine-rich repeats domain-containing protein n=1 Tax=Ziziphus jujuba var. spinosa TaxID=714518 RepID=A0A978W3G9_ZIZJJ|nr:hypothetical protein FEM48_Zijuj01G0207700 [Ziziphus jujuba var. spinosa]
MHDLIRDMALQITSVSPQFLVEAGVLLRDIPDEEKWTEDLERVSLMHNYISTIPPGAAPRCPRLLTLMLNNNLLESISDSFFVHMSGLCVLDLSSTEIENLPDSFSNLVSLTVLLIRRCQKLRTVPSLANLKALRRLELCYTGITQVPQEHLLSSVSSRSFSFLENLEELNLTNLVKFHAFVGRERGVSSLLQSCTFSSLKKISLQLCPDIRILFTPALAFHLQNLENLCVKYCQQMVEIVSSYSEKYEDENGEVEIQEGNCALEFIFPKLRILELWDVLELKSIYNSKKAGDFDSLQQISISNCPKLRIDFISLPILEGESHPLPSLRKIKVDEEWWDSHECDNPAAKHVLEPLCEFCFGKVLVADSLQEISIWKCPMHDPVLSQMIEINIEWISAPCSYQIRADAKVRQLKQMNKDEFIIRLPIRRQDLFGFNGEWLEIDRTLEENGIPSIIIIQDDNLALSEYGTTERLEVT